MDIRLLVIDIAEKLCLVATAALVSVLLPPLRNRLLGIGGQRRDRLLASTLGILLAMWGAKMGQIWLGVHVNFLAIGVLMGVVFQVGIYVGVFAGLFYLFRVVPSLDIAVNGWAVLAAAAAMGAGGDFLYRKKPAIFTTWQVFPAAVGLQVLAIGIVALVQLTSPAALLRVWPPLLVQVVSNATGILIFVGVSRVVLAREESAIALAEAQAATNRFALEALRRRLEPHFLFNAFNTLRATIRVDPTRARSLVSDLSDLYRYLLTHPEDASLASEVEHASAYLAIERARLGEGRLQVRTNIDASVATLLVPALLLQPLVENAVKHGVGAYDGKGTVSISAFRAGPSMVEIVVEDSTTGVHVGVVEAGSGIALSTLRERLSKRYGDDATIELLEAERGMKARVRLPIEETE